MERGEREELEREWAAMLWDTMLPCPSEPMKFVAVLGPDGVLKTWVRPASAKHTKSEA